MKNLFEVESTRPALNCVSIREVAEEIAPDIIKWKRSNQAKWKMNDQVTIEDVVEDFEECFFSASSMHSDDGYELAKELEKYCNYDSDTELVEILERVSYIFWDLYKEKVKEWVKKYEIKPAYEIGDNIYFTDSSNVKDSGKIVDIKLDTAEYVIRTEEFDIKYPNNAGEYSGCIIKYEKVEKL